MQIMLLIFPQLDKKIPCPSLFAKVILFLFAAIFFSGCAFSPRKLGISDVEWQSYPKEKQQQLIANYRQIADANKAEDQKAQAKVQAGTQTLGEQEQSWLVAAAPTGEGQQGKVAVKFISGSAVMPPFVTWQNFAPAVFTIMPDTCQEIWLYALSGQLSNQDKNIKVAMRVCYQDKILHFDPSRYDFGKQVGTVSIPFSPLWDRGFVYHNINSYGYVRLKNAMIKVKQID